MSNHTDIVAPQEAALGTGRESPGEANIASVLQAAVEREMPPESLEKLFALYERDRNWKAEAAFNAALAAFKAECPVIVKGSRAKIVSRKGTSFQYQYAGPDDIDKAIRPIMAKHGLSYRWGDTIYLNEDRMLRSTCIVLHAEGHSTSSVGPPVPWESEAGCSPQQKMGVATAYARRYALVDALGLVASDDDVDGNAPPPSDEPISAEQAKAMSDLIEELSRADNINVTAFMEYFKIERIADLRKSQYHKAMAQLEKKAGRRK